MDERQQTVPAIILCRHVRIKKCIPWWHFKSYLHLSCCAGLAEFRTRSLRCLEAASSIAQSSSRWRMETVAVWQTLFFSRFFVNQDGELRFLYLGNFMFGLQIQDTFESKLIHLPRWAQMDTRDCQIIQAQCSNILIWTTWLGADFHKVVQ